MSSLLSLYVIIMACSDGVAFKVAIIGGGIGGASSAYFLRKLLPTKMNAEIYLFNSGDVGGRVKTVRMRFNDQMRSFEAGGSIIHPANLYVKRWLSELNLHKKETPHEKGVMGIWNGKEFVFMKSSWYVVTLYRLWKRYGLDLLKNRFEIWHLLNDFEIIYKMLDKGLSFNTIDDMALSMSTGLGNLMNLTIKDHLVKSGYHAPFITEYAAAALNCNYGQSIEELHGFVGSVGLAGSVSGLYSINGSNKLVIEKLISHSKAELISAEVALISSRGNYFVLFDNDGQELGSDFNYVIVAVPLHQKQNLQIQGKNLEDQRGKFKQIVATFVEGSLRAKHWSVTDDDMLNTVFVCNNNLPYNAIGQLSPVDYKKSEPFPKAGSYRIWKVFSKKDLTDSELKLYFSEIRNVTKVTFLAYPDYKEPPFGRPRFSLSKGICFVNAIEWMASTMETSAIGARNCVNMLLKDFGLLESDKTKRPEL